jgi:hypothetical protein
MKNLFEISQREKKSILSQHKGSIKVVTESFFKNINATIIYVDKKDKVRTGQFAR